MKKTLYIISLSFMLCVSQSGCGTPSSRAYKTLGTTTLSVESALKGWNEYLGSGRGTLDEERAVKKAYENYQLAMKLCELGIVSYNTNQDKTKLEQVLQAVKDSRSALVSLVISFTNKN